MAKKCTEKFVCLFVFVFVFLFFNFFNQKLIKRFVFPTFWPNPPTFVPDVKDKNDSFVCDLNFFFLKKLMEKDTYIIFV
jgi:hypothetical protein